MQAIKDEQTWGDIFSQWKASCAAKKVAHAAIPERVKIEGFVVSGEAELQSKIVLWLDRGRVQAIRDALASRSANSRPWTLFNFENQINSGRDAYPGIRQTAEELIRNVGDQEVVSAIWLYAWLRERFTERPSHWAGPTAMLIANMQIAIGRQMEALGLALYQGNIKRTLPSYAAHADVYEGKPPQSMAELFEFTICEVSRILEDTVIAEATGTDLMPAENL